MSYRWHRREPLRIFVGYDAKEAVAYQVLAASIWRRATVPVSITPLVRDQLQTIHTRPRGPLESTDFAFTRFLVPYLCSYHGHAIFMDCDFLCLADVAELWPYLLDMSGPVTVCQHDYIPKTQTKFLAQPQTAYPRKNWSSLMLFDNTQCTALTPNYVNAAPGLDLHRFAWAEEVGSLPLEWNWLVGEYADRTDVRMMHYTLGGPWFEEYAHGPLTEPWWQEYRWYQQSNEVRVTGVGDGCGNQHHG